MTQAGLEELDDKTSKHEEQEEFEEEFDTAMMFLETVKGGLNERGFLKLDGKIVTLSPDKGGASLPLDSWQDYAGSDYAFTLMRTGEDGEDTGMENTSWPGSLSITDVKGKTVYEAEGTLQCGS